MNSSSKRLKFSFNRPKRDYSKKIRNLYKSKNKNIEVKEEIMNRLKMEKFINDTRQDYNEKISCFGKDMVNEFFPEQQEKIDIKKMREELYYKNKCDLIKYKQMSNKIDFHQVYFVDSINLIGNLASELPRPTANPEEIWNKLLEPLKMKNKKKTSQ